MTALNRTVAFGTGEDDGYPDDALNDNGPAEDGEPEPEDEG